MSLAFACKDKWWEYSLPPPGEQEIAERLAAEGIIVLPVSLQMESRKYRRVDVSGEPCSETILKERR